MLSRVDNQRNGLINERDNAVRILIEKGADPNTRDDAGRNALMVMSLESGDPSRIWSYDHRIARDNRSRKRAAPER